MTDYPEHPTLDGKVIDAELHLLDRLLVDRDGVPVSVVNDVEIEERDDGPPRVTHLVLGSAIVPRFLGGHPPLHRLERLPWSKVAELGTALTLAGDRAESDDVWFEDWLRRHVVGRIPGGRHDPE